MKKEFLIVILIALPIALYLVTRQGNNYETHKQAKDDTIDTQLQNTPVEKIKADNYCKGKTGQKACPKKGTDIAVLETNHGTIKIKFFRQYAPKTVDNFKKLAKDGFYDGLIFHRVISGFMIQGGDPDGTGAGGPGYTIDAEIVPTDKLSHVAGAVATARQGDQINPEKKSSGSQFYIVHNDTGAKSLDGDYTIFAQVISGMNVVEDIANVATDQSDKPLQDVIIESATIEKY